MVRKLIFAFVVVIIINRTDIIFGCSCLRSESAQVEFASSDVVFTGEVVEEGSAVTFKILKAFKGISDHSVVVYRSSPLSTPSGQSMDSTLYDVSAMNTCDYPFVVHGRYLVYATYQNNTLTTSVCSRTKNLSDASEDIKTLEKIMDSTSLRGEWKPRRMPVEHKIEMH